MEYNFRQIEKRWQQWWKDNDVYKTPDNFSKPKYYVLDMFPYPSGAGLHVGHPLGYIASDIYARYKRLKGFNVLHPMGYDAFGLPAEQYAIEHGIHPAVSTENNISNFRKQLDNIGFCFDWSREGRTSDPAYYKWTQWIFLQLFHSFYNRKKNKAEHIDVLIDAFNTEGNISHPFPDGQYHITLFTADEWKSFSEKEQQGILMQYRLAFCGYGEVNWCEALGTVLANDEVINGVSERGGYPVVKKKLRQWYLRITEYADRLLEGLDRIEFSESMKEMQTNWIGKSSGAEIEFKIQNSKFKIIVYTTRPDTIFGVDFMVIAPEHELVETITTPEQKQAVDDYITYVKSRSERERMAEKKISGVFTGTYVLNPFDNREIPVWISEYVLAGYGTGAIMAVPCGDERDFKFAKHFNIPVTNIIGKHFNGEEANATKDAILENSGFINGMVMREAMDVVIDKLEDMGIGTRKVNYKMRDAAFSRQRYWGEPFPIVWKNDIAYPLDEKELPLILPEIKEIKPGKDGEGPLTNLTEWIHSSPAGGGREGATMPGYAGSSWYFLRYMDPHNDTVFCDRKLSDYWNQVDLYIGGTEHAVGHLLYSRMWTKALYDLGFIGFDEPYKKLVNQGMIQGNSAFANVVAFTFGANLMVTLNDEQKKKIERLKAKYKDPENISLCVSEDLMKYLNTTYLSPENEAEEEHMKFQSILYNILLKPIEGDLLELDDIIRIHPFLRFYKIHIPIEYVNHKDELDEERLKQEDSRFTDKEFIVFDDKSKFICSREIEKMSKSKYNVVNPDDIINKYGADTFRMYEMFLGPVELSKPWDTKGIEGVHRFLKKLWRLFYKESTTNKQEVVSFSPSTGGGQGEALWTNETPTDAEYKILYKSLKKIQEDTERFSFNTAVSAFMILVNELTDAGCHKKEILEKMLIVLAPYAPHIAEELWQALNSSPSGEGRDGASVLDAAYPAIEEKYLIETSKEYPIAINGKTRATMNVSLDATQQDVEAMVLANELVIKWLDGKQPKKIIYVKNRMINVVI